MTLCFFLLSGKTFTFKNCSNVVSNESMITFRYTAMSDEKAKSGIFFTSNLGGWSQSDIVTYTLTKGE